ncbi:MAG TPA: VIT1/CCC1 transporter family protein [Acidobacteriota bacterium]|jgi:VIT1/CCC1 family predicted Fe2+/Mn2+ transporter|nr:VIT1/CCC1 transporter family protein [Acidobacteriota bacterium]
MADTEKIQRYIDNWQDERNGAALYDAISKAEKDPKLKAVYKRMSEAEERHSRFWQSKLEAANQPLPKFKLNWRTRTLMLLAKYFGPRFVLPNVLSLERLDSHKYDMQTDAEELSKDEQSHARLLEAIASDQNRTIQTAGGRIAELEGRHRNVGGNALRAAVLGANDGLVSNFSLVMGVAGANLSNQSVLITGVAGLLAGACSMALGEWLSVQSARELYERQIEVERKELEEMPEEEAEELSLIYQAKGLSEHEATNLADRLIKDKSQALDTLAREELGVNPDDLGGSPWTAAATSFLLFAAGAIVPVIPFMFLSGFQAIIVSAIFAVAGLFGIGAGITLLTGRNVFYSGMRQVAFGLAAALITFILGRLFNAAITG